MGTLCIMPKAPPIRPRSSPEKTRADRAEAIRLRELGWTNPAIAKHLDLSVATVVQGFHKTGWAGLLRRCALEECGKEFRTFRLKGAFCCQLHSKRHLARQAVGTVGLFTGDIECALPECRKTAPRQGIVRTYCSRKHGDLHQRRLDRAKSSMFYERVLGAADNACVVCAERLVLDEHHVEYSNGRSNKQSKTVWLCPTHHMAIHRGFARFDGDKFVWTVEDIREGLARKHPAIVESIGGKSWGSK